MALVVVLLILVIVNVWVHVGPRRAQLVTGPLAAAALIAVGRAAGLSWEQLGLGPGSLARGARWGGVCAGIVVAGFAVLVAVPPAHRFFRDVRYRLGLRPALATALLAVPLGTVVFEEVAFRGVLWGLIEDAKGPAWATAATSLLFGAWHILPALDLARTNTALAGSGGRPSWSRRCSARWPSRPPPASCSPSCAGAAEACSRRSCCTGPSTPRACSAPRSCGAWTADRPGEAAERPPQVIRCR